MSVKPTYEELERYGRQADITIENLEMKLAESQREFRASDATIENIQMELEKLAAENAELKSAIEKHADSYIMCGYCRTERDGKNDDVCEVLDSTPATDAFLAEVLAQGVEMAVDVVKQCYDNICAGGLQENREYEESIVQPHLDGIDDELKEIIAQLRKGAAQ